MKTPSDIINLADTYVTTIYFGIIAMMFYNTTASILRGIGDSKTPLYFLIFSSFLNIGLDLLFIIQFNLGVQGAALATILSQAISAVIGMTYMFAKYEFLRPNLVDFKINFDVCKKLLAVGLSMALNYSIIAIGVMFLQSGVNQFGSSAVAAFTAASKIENLATQAMPALGAGVATFAAQNLGAKQYERIFEGVKTSIYMGIVVSLVSILIYVFFTEAIVRLFIPDITSESMFYATKYLYTCSYFMIFLQFIFIFRNVLQSIGNQFIPVVSGILELLARFVVIVYLAVALAEPFAWILASIINVVFYYRWQRDIKTKILNNTL
jgi:putative MATE family efflux protein